jgi:toluene monooxygenase electron transfer component
VKIEIEKKEQSFSFEVEQGEKILYAGLRAGVPLPYECATGTCGTCKARLKEGDLDSGWQQAPGRQNLKADRKEFLMCQAKANLDCKIGVPAAIKQFRHDDLRPDYVTGVASTWQRLTHDVMQFEVTLDAPLSFHAGQFFVVKTPGVEGFRAYSMVNYAPQTDTLKFIVKKKPDGGFSEWVFDNERGEDMVEMFGPIGRATFHPDENHDLFMIAGGSGIAGLMSILQHASEIDYFDDHRATVFFGVRTQKDVFFVEQLSSIQNRFPDTVQVNIIFSDEKIKNDAVTGLGALQPGYGMVHEAALKGITPGTPNTMAYLAGPPPMVDACIRPLILDLKFGANMIRYDKFG